MQRLLLALCMVLLMAGSVAAHGNISKLPDSVQILQYKMKLYMNADDADTKNNLAMVYVRTGQLKEAKEQLAAILEKDPQNFDSNDEMGVVMIMENKADNAMGYLRKAQQINNNDLMLHVHLSVANEMLNRKAVADEELAKAKSMASGPEELTAIEAEIKMLKTNPKVEV